MDEDIGVDEIKAGIAVADAMVIEVAILCWYNATDWADKIVGLIDAIEAIVLVIVDDMGEGMFIIVGGGWWLACVEACETVVAIGTNG